MRLMQNGFALFSFASHTHFLELKLTPGWPYQPSGGFCRWATPIGALPRHRIRRDSLSLCLSAYQILSAALRGGSVHIQFASMLCRSVPNHLKDNHSLSSAASCCAFPIRLSSWLFFANPPRFLPKLLLCLAPPSTARLFHVGSDQTLLFPIWSGPVCAMPSLSEQIQFKERQFRFRSLLTSPMHFCASPVQVGS